MKDEKQQKPLMYPTVPAQGMSEIMDFIRQPDWRPQINLALIKKLNIATNNEGQVLSALRFLGLIDDNGNPTQNFDDLKKDFQPTIKHLLLERYRDLFAILPPSLITRKRLLSFFGEPAQGAVRRARFFIWLCAQAGIELPGVVNEKERAD